MSAPFRTPPDALLSTLKGIVGESGWRGSEDAGRYGDDPRGRFTGEARIVLMPDTTDKVAAIVRACAADKIGIIPYGGGTGVVAGQLSIDSDQAIILSLERMNRVRALSPDDGVLVAEAGCILEDIHAAAADHGLQFPLSMASKGSCSIGGNLATNAGGIQVLRYGNARDLCLGVEAVMPDGSVLNALSPLRKNNTGYDLRHLLIGSEGTLGIITAASLVLKPIDDDSVTAMCAVASPSDALRVYQRLRKALGEGISALELMSGLGLTLVPSHFPTLRSPFAETPDWCLLLEATGPDGFEDRVQMALADCLEAELMQDAVIASSQSQRDALWNLREFTPEANRLEGAFCNSDTAVPIGRVDAFISATLAALAAIHPDLRVNSYGHIGDGNIHHNVFPPKGTSKADFLAEYPGIIDRVRLAINDTTVAEGGSISAEHGIGRLKTSDLETYGEPTKLAVMRQIKQALDPDGIMNPGALIR